jgi:hypothetical protein
MWEEEIRIGKGLYISRNCSAFAEVDKVTSKMSDRMAGNLDQIHTL